MVLQIMEKEDKRHCLTCDTPLSGRSDKKFCDDQSRATYNNRNKASHERNLQRLNSRLRRNRTILKSLCPVGKATVRKEVLDEMGFDFRYCTSLFGNPGKVYFFCYDYGYMPIIERSLTEQRPIQKVSIIQKQSFMDRVDPWVMNQ